MSECVFDQALMIPLACLPHFNDLLSEHFARHCSFVVRSKSATRSSQHIPVSNADEKILVSLGSKAAVLRSSSIGIVALASASSSTC